jgi:signal transduction histidine kinase
VLELHDTEEELLKGIAVMSSSLLALSYAANDARRFAEERAIEAMVEGVPPDQLSDTSVLAKRQEMEASLQLARDQITELSRQVVQLTIQLDDERSRLATALDDSQEDLSISQRLTALNDEQRKLREERDQLAARLQEAEAALAAATQPDNKAVVQKLIEGLEREKTDLMAQRENLQTQVDDLQIADRALLPQELQKVIRGMAEEKSRLESERDQLSRELAEIENQLRSVGISDPSTGLSQLIGKLSEQQAILQAKFDAVKAERDILINEHGRLNDGKEKERETRIQTLQTELVQVAADREAAIKQRDRLRTERDEIVAKLETVKQHRARLLAQSAGYEIELAEAHEQQAKLHVEIQQLSDERSELLRRHDDLVAEKQALETERDQLMARVDGDRERLKQLGEDGVGSLTKMIETLSTQRSQLERELHETRSRLAEVTNRLDALQVRSDADPSITEAVKYQPENPDLVIGLVQELRTPMTSVSGYIDLLLGETPGILGEMQRKFLERVAANVTRLASMIDDLVRVTELDTGHVALEPEPVDIVSLIDDAINNASAQFREKGLTVQLDLDNDLPAVRADRDAMTQIIGQLLTNAYLVSPPGSDIFITAKRKNINLSRNGNSNTHSTTDSLFVSVEDRGGGISPEDAARVFARKYKAENPLIAGLGDTGVGLSIAKALVEAHDGRLWLETRPNLGSIFNFALPLNATVEVEGEH